MHMTMMSTMYMQAIDVAMVALPREEKHALYMQMVEGGRKVTASACRNAYIDLPYRGHMAALTCLNVPQTLKTKGILIQLRSNFAFHFSLLHQQPHYQHPTPNPKPSQSPVPILWQEVKTW